MDIITAEHLTRSYGTRRGIESLKLSVSEGVLFGFLGPNGAGKSTLIRVLLGLLRPTRGAACVFGLDCWKQTRAIKKDVGYLPGDLRLYSWMTASDALRFAGRVRRRDLTRPGRELAEQFELEMDVPVRKMSRGNRQKLGLVLAMAHEPRLLILDEPTSGLDPLMQATAHQLLRQSARAGRTVFLSSHSLGEVEQICDRVAIVRAGRLVANNTLAELQKQAGHRVVIHWPDESAARGLSCPDFFREVQREGRTWSAIMTGDINDLFSWLAHHSVDDLSVGRPDLETLFHQYYESEQP